MPSLLPPERVIIWDTTYIRAPEGQPSDEARCPGCVADFDRPLCQQLVGQAGCYTGDDREIPTIWVKAE
jgi:protein-arginine kinase activator protein McsA